MKMLDKFKKLNKFLQKKPAEPVNFDEIGAILSELLASNSYVFSKKGKLLGYSLMEGFGCQVLIDDILSTEKKEVSAAFNTMLIKTSEPAAENINNNNKCLFLSDESCAFDNMSWAIIPTYGGNSRMGTLVLSRLEQDFIEEELVLADYAATVIGHEILRSKNEEQMKEIREQTEASSALNKLSYSEMEAISLLFKDFEGEENIVVTSEIADRAGITRSVVVNALRKLESAGVVESRSLGMKGTLIRVLNKQFLNKIKDPEEELREQYPAV